MGEDGTTNVINERVMSDEFARLLFKLLLLHAGDDPAAKESSCCVQSLFVCNCALREWKYKYAMTRVFFLFFFRVSLQEESKFFIVVYSVE